MYIQDDINDYSTTHSIVQQISTSSATTNVQSKTFGDTVKQVLFSVPAGASMKISIMLVKGTYTSDNYPAYEKYVGGTASPNPDYPQIVETVTGRQEVNIVGKNLFDKSKITTGKLVDRDNGSLVTNNDYGATDYIPIGENVTIALTNFNVWYTACYDKSKNYIGHMDNSQTMTTLANTAYVRASLLLTNLDTAQIEKNSQASEYQAYIGNTYEINLGKNIFDGEIERGSYSQTTGEKSSSTTQIRSVDKIPVKPNTTYIFSTSNGAITTRPRVFYYSNGTFLSSALTTTAGVFTTGNNVDYIAFASATYPLDTKFQIEVGDKISSYAPYKTPIELCKIDTYQDKIAKSTGKNLFDEQYPNINTDLIYMPIFVGNGTFTMSTTTPKTQNGYANLFFLPGEASTGASTSINGVSDNVSRTIQSTNGYVTIAYRNETGVDPRDYYTTIEQNTQATEYEPYGTNWYIKNAIEKISSYNGETITTNYISTTGQLTTGATVYYVLATPTYTEITDTELIGELENVELLEGINNIDIDSGDHEMLKHGRLANLARTRDNDHGILFRHRRYNFLQFTMNIGHRRPSFGRFTC